MNISRIRALAYAATARITNALWLVAVIAGMVCVVVLMAVPMLLATAHVISERTGILVSFLWVPFVIGMVAKSQEYPP